MLATGLAFLSAVLVWRAARLPVQQSEAERQDELKRRLRYVALVLLFDLRLLAKRARSAEGTIVATIAANKDVNDRIVELTTLEIDPISDQWEFMSLLPSAEFSRYAELRRDVADHNFDMQRAGGAFGADQFRSSIKERVKRIQNSASTLANEFAAISKQVKPTLIEED